jgi:hypothetical protein
VKVDLSQLDLPTQILLGEIRPFVWSIQVSADQHHLAIEALLPQAEGGGVARSASADDHDTSTSHGSILDPECAAAAAVGAVRRNVPLPPGRAQRPLEDTRLEAAYDLVL